MRFSKKLISKLSEDVKPEDFKEDTLLRMIAEKDIALALEVSSYFGGIKEYIPTPIQAVSYAMSKYIKRERNQCKTVRVIALELGISLRQIARFKTFDDGVEETLPDAPL